jgi:hypothetical protein
MPCRVRRAALVVIMLACSGIGWGHADGPAVADLAWQRRLVLMSAATAADPQLREQQRLLAGWSGAAERDITMVQIAGGTVHGVSDPAERLRTRFALPADGFMVLLVGKDGHVALRSSRPLSLAELAGTIDAMPMRRAEVASRQVDASAVHPAREQLVGAWRLVSIETKNAAGLFADPFFAAGSTGLIVYDASGWVSVQISGPGRQPWPVPASRLPETRAQNLRLKGAAYDTYYAYVGTWDYDPRDARMTHHVKSSLIAAEVGVDYVQGIELAGNRLTFTSQSHETGGEELTRTKVWERIDR